MKVFNIKTFVFYCVILLTTSVLATNNTPQEKEGIKYYNDGLKLANEALYLSDIKKYEESLVLLDKALKKFPRLMRAYYVKSRVLTILKRYKEAIKTCDEALILNEKQPRILSQKSLCLYILQQYKESLEVAKIAVKYGQNLPIAYEMRANAYSTLGNFELALSDYSKTLELVKNPNDAKLTETYLNRFCPLYKLKRYEEALETCNKALEITDNSSKLPQVYSKKAAALNALGKHQEALENAQRSLEIDIKDPLGISEKKIAEKNLKKLEQKPTENQKKIG